MGYWHWMNPINTAPQFVRRVALLVAVGAVPLGAGLVCKAVHNEVSGTAIFYTGWKRDKGEPVTREAAPEKFRRATNLFWATGTLCLGVSALGWMFFRKLDDCLAEPF